jgi:uncharacterized membrane protein
MRQAFAGALLVVAGIAAFIVASTHHPLVYCGEHCGHADTLRVGVSPWSSTAYDLVRIAAWALVIFGSLLVVAGLIRFWSETRMGRAL